MIEHRDVFGDEQVKKIQREERASVRRYRAQRAFAVEASLRSELAFSCPKLRKLTLNDNPLVCLPHCLLHIDECPNLPPSLQAAYHRTPLGGWQTRRGTSIKPILFNRGDLLYCMKVFIHQYPSLMA